MDKNSFARVACAIGMAVVASFQGAHAGEFPDRPVKLVVPYPAGGGGDTAARIIAEKLTALWKQPVVIENKTGAGTTIGSAYVAAANPDGYTLLMAGLTGYITSGILYKNLSYDYQTSLVPVAALSIAPFVVIVNPKSKATNMKELLDLARKTPGGITYGSSGLGAGGHLAAEMISGATNVQLNHVPYRGSAPAITAVMAGQIDMAIADVSAMPQVAQGNLRALAVTTSSRSALAPGVPTLAEAGVENVDVPSGQGIMAPAGTPRDIIDRINKSINEALKTEDVRNRYIQSGFLPAPGTPEDLGASIASQAKHYGEVLARLNLKLD